MADLRKRLTEIRSLNFQAQYLQTPNTEPDNTAFWEGWPYDVLEDAGDPPFRNEPENRNWVLKNYFNETPVPVDIKAVEEFFWTQMEASLK